MEIVFATKNEGKLKEIRAILQPVKVVSMAEYGIDLDVVEDGTTFEENARKKAVEIMEHTHTVVLADDSGLEIDALDKAPGVYSARYLGEDTPYDIKNRKILEMLRQVPQEKRSARFVCVICAAFPDGKICQARGTIEGIIGYESKGKNGFGYDPIFYVPEYQMTTAEMPPALKNEISHRAKALQKIKEMLVNDENTGSK